MSIRFDVISLFPDMFAAVEKGVIGRASPHHIQIHHWNPRDYTSDVHHTVDDRPYGGGPGMVMLFEPLFAAITAAKMHNPGKVIYLSPQGQTFNQRAAKTFSHHTHLILLCGRYEGIDQRIIDHCVDEEWSVGDYVVSGGELPAMILIDAISRLIPGVLGHADSAAQDSFSDHKLDHPHYTRPVKIPQGEVPEVLRSGHHEAIARWRLKQSLGKTWQMRKDLIKSDVLTALEKQLLNEFIQEAKK